MIVKSLKHADSNVSSSREMESNECIHRATAGARGRAAAVRNSCYRLSALLWKQACGGGLHSEDAQKSSAEFWRVGAGCLQVASSC